MSRLVLASRNAHKARELAEMLGRDALEPLPDAIALPPETGATFAENARIKAFAAAAALGPGVGVLADDSGLECAGLGGEPGVRSARFAGEDAADEDNLALLLARLDGVADRRAAYVCALVEVGADGRVRAAEARCAGTIVAEPRGRGGFGYDPAFLPSGGARTMAELSAAEKHAISHRGIAARLLADAPWVAQ